jgi:hypothetical protein
VTADETTRRSMSAPTRPVKGPIRMIGHVLWKRRCACNVRRHTTVIKVSEVGQEARTQARPFM